MTEDNKAWDGSRLMVKNEASLKEVNAIIVGIVLVCWLCPDDPKSLF